MTKSNTMIHMRGELAGKKKGTSKKEFWRRAEKFAMEMARTNPGASFSRGLIEMRSKIGDG